MSERLLILSDGKPGHVNQSIAFARHLGRDYDLCAVRCRNRLAKGISYLADACHLRWSWLFEAERIAGDYAAVVSAGSETYYANRLLAARLGSRSVAIMLPRGYRYDFDLILAQEHDRPPQQQNILSLPVNLSYIEPQGLVNDSGAEPVVSLIIGGDSRSGRLEVDQLRRQLDEIFALFPRHRFWLTTSRRTSPEIEALLRGYPFAYALYYSEQQVNPMADFITRSDYLFVTADSSSMISEAVSGGSAAVEVLPLRPTGTERPKFERFLSALIAAGCLQLFNGRPGERRTKIDLAARLAEVSL